jgi:hypothetical protein
MSNCNAMYIYCNSFLRNYMQLMSLKIPYAGNFDSESFGNFFHVSFSFHNPTNISPDCQKLRIIPSIAALSMALFLLCSLLSENFAHGFSAPFAYADAEVG